MKKCSARRLALLASQAGPRAARVITSRPTSPELTLDSASFRVLLLRSFCVDLALVAAFCRCRRQLDVLGDHLAGQAEAPEEQHCFRSCGRFTVKRRGPPPPGGPDVCRGDKPSHQHRLDVLGTSIEHCDLG